MFNRNRVIALVIATAALASPLPATAATRSTSSTETIAAKSRRIDPAAPKLFDDSRPRAGSTASPYAGPTEIAWSSDCDGDPATAKPYCTEPDYYRVFGKITYARKKLVADLDDPHPKAPQYAYTDLAFDGMTGAREVLLRVSDGCGLHTDTYTDADGAYSVAFPSWCGDKPAKVTVYSLSSPGAGKQVSLGLYTGEPEMHVIDDIEDDPSQYTVISGQVGTFVPKDEAAVPAACKDNSCDGGRKLDRSFLSQEEGTLYQQGKMARKGEVARAFTIMGNVMTAFDYYRQLVDPSRLPQINVVLTSNAFDGGDNTAVYLPSKSRTIYIPPRMEWSEWAVMHETGHYFDGGILVEGGLGNYGRWGEAMANVRAGSILGTSWMSGAEDLASENLDVQGNWDQASDEVEVEDLPESGPGQGWIWRILWDLHDGGAETPEPLDFGFGEFDQWNGGGGSSGPLDHLINGVVLEYLPQRDGTVHPDYVDRGQDGPDLVDMLDGFACLYGLDLLTFETLLRDVMGYDYDFAHCSEPDDVSP